jgi:hypothetical protein
MIGEQHLEIYWYILLAINKKIIKHKKIMLNPGYIQELITMDIGPR